MNVVKKKNGGIVIWIKCSEINVVKYLVAISRMGKEERCEGERES